MHHFYYNILLKGIITWNIKPLSNNQNPLFLDIIN